MIKRINETATYIIESCGLYKIGKTRDWSKRKGHYNTHNPQWSLVFIVGNNVEKELHDEFKDKRVTGEWFKLEDKDIIRIISTYKQADLTQIDYLNKLSFKARCLYNEILETKTTEYIPIFDATVAAFKIDEKHFSRVSDTHYTSTNELDELLINLFIVRDKSNEDGSTTCYIKHEIIPLSKKIGMYNIRK